MIPRNFKSKKRKTNFTSKLHFNSNPNQKNNVNTVELGLILLDQNVIRKEVLGHCQRTLKKIDKAKAEIDQFEKVDKPAYEKWIQENFGELIKKIRSYSLEIQEKRAFIDEIQEEAFLKQITFIEAYKIIKYKREHPEEFEKSKSETNQKKKEYREKNAEEKDEEDIFREDINDFFRKFHTKFNLNEEEFSSYKRDFETGTRGQNQEFDMRLKERYRLIVHKLHPDKNKKANQLEKELWHEAQEAYRHRDLEKLDFIIVLYNVRFGFIGIENTIFDLKFANVRLEKSLKEFSQKIRRSKQEPSWLFLKMKPTKLSSLKKEADKEFRDYEKNTSVELKEINNILDKWERGTISKSNQNYKNNYKQQKDAEEDFLNFYANF